MIYFCLNKSGILDPLLESLYEKYFTTCVVYWNSGEKDKVKDAPFFSDKWLLVIDARDLINKENSKLLENRHVDILCEVSSEDEFNKAFSYCDRVISEFCINCEKTKSRLMKDWDLSKDKFELLMENFQKKQYLSSYKVSEKYLSTYIKWYLFTREGNQYGEKTDMSNGERWRRASELELAPLQALNLQSLTKLVHGNESRLLTVLNLVGIDILDINFLMESGEYFPKPKYVTINNFPLYLFSNDKRKKKDILNLVYKYRGNTRILKKSILDFCDTFEILSRAFSSGELSIKNRDNWFSSRGYELGITSEFKGKLWWICINNISLERIYVIKNKMQKNSFDVYKYIVELCRKEL